MKKVEFHPQAYVRILLLLLPAFVNTTHCAWWYGRMADEKLTLTRDIPALRHILEKKVTGMKKESARAWLESQGFSCVYTHGEFSEQYPGVYRSHPRRDMIYCFQNGQGIFSSPRWQLSCPYSASHVVQTVLVSYGVIGL